jgi:hypothetical protein
MISPPQRLKEAANALALTLASDPGFRILSLLKRLASEPSAPGSDGNLCSPEKKGRARVGIWEAQEKSGEVSFVRMQTGEPWSFWANEPRIGPKTARKRVVLLGESVARGFFYDPKFNPASALRSLLQRDNVEVVDLARIDLTIRQLEQLMFDSLALQPDALVLFAGNNWHPVISFDAARLEEVAGLVRSGAPWSEVKSFLEACLEGQVSSFLDSVAKVSAEHHIPAVFVLPEGNLADWRDECSAPPLLDAVATEKWLAARRRAQAALSGNDYDAAGASAREMMDLDSGTTSIGPGILAEVEAALGHVPESRVYLELARDAGICWPRPESPRCYSTIQAKVRSQAPRLGLTLVDLPMRFREYLGDELPGRRLFHDYCHLTVEGVRVAMASVAESLLPLLGLPPIGWRALAEIEVPIDPGTVAHAHFLAAIHNANWGQPPELLRHHCDEAVRNSPAVERSVRLFLDFYIRRQPSCFCHSFEQMGQMHNLALMNHLFNPGALLRPKSLNVDLVEALTGAAGRLDGALPGNTRSLLFREHGVEAGRVDLLKKCYTIESLPTPLDQGRYGYYRAYARESLFQLIVSGSCDIELKIVHREPMDAAMCVAVNGVCIGSLTPTERWREDRVLVNRERIVAGVNTISVHWPPACWDHAAMRDRIAERLEAGDIPEIRGVYGEIYEFTSTIC